MLGPWMRKPELEHLAPRRAFVDRLSQHRRAWADHFLGDVRGGAADAALGGGLLLEPQQPLVAQRQTLAQPDRTNR